MKIDLVTPEMQRQTEAVARRIAAKMANALGIDHEVRYPDGRRERFEAPATPESTDE